jgi:WD40 repeat protein
LEIWNPEAAEKALASFSFDADLGRSAIYAVSPAKRRLAMATGTTVSVWNLSGTTGTLTFATPDAQRSFDREITAVTFSGTGDALGVGDDSGGVRVWSPVDSASAPRAVLDSQSPDRITAIALNADGKLVAAGTDSGRTMFLNMTAAPLARRESLSNARVTSVSFSPDERLLSTGSKDGSVRFWPIAAFPEKARELVAYGSSVNAIAFSPDSKRLAAGGGDRTVRVWRLDGNDQVPDSVLRGLKSYIKAVAFTADGHFVVAADGSKVASPRVWIAEAGRLADLVCDRVGHHDLTRDEAERIMEGETYRPCVAHEAQSSAATTAHVNRTLDHAATDPAALAPTVQLQLQE